MPADWIIAVIDREGTVVARRPDAARWVGQPSTKDMKEQLTRGNEGSFEAVSLDGRADGRGVQQVGALRLGVRDRGPARGLRQQPRSIGAEPSRSARSRLLAIAMIGAAWVARGIERPVYALQAAARSLERGEVVKPEPTGGVESDEVAAILAQASEKIARSRVELEERVEAAVRQTKDALQQLSQSQRLEALGQLTGGVAHDFNNLLAVIGNNTFVLQRSAPGQDTSGPLGAITRAVQVGSRLTGHLLRFARRSVIKPEVIDLSQHLPSLADILKTALGSAISVAMRVEPTTRKIECDTGELELALINLAVNSRDAMPSGGEFIVVARNATAAEAGGLADRRLCRDRGVRPGRRHSAAGDRPRVRAVLHDQGARQGNRPRPEPGLRLLHAGRRHRAHPRDVGRGHDGADAAAGDGEGLRRAAHGRRAGAGARAPRTAAGRRQRRARPGHRDVADACSAIAVTRASSAEDAIQLLDAGEVQFDVVLSDVVMPGGMNGVSFAQYLRKNLPEMPIILITGYASHLREKHGFEILQKPCAPDVLLAALRRATGQPARSEAGSARAQAPARQAEPARAARSASA